MTREKWAKMSEDERRIKIAELCGWKPNGAGYWHRRGKVAALEAEVFDGCGGIGEDTDALPNYLNDLNAMHEAEKQLEDSAKRKTYIQWLREIGYTDYRKVFDPIWALTHATAAQRAEALALTLEPG